MQIKVWRLFRNIRRTNKQERKELADVALVRFQSSLADFMREKRHFNFSSN